MLTIGRIFSHRITRNISTLTIPTQKTSSTVGDCFLSGQKTKTILQRFSEWRDNLLYACSLSECRQQSYRELYSAEKYKIAQSRGLFFPNFLHPERMLESSEIDELVRLSDNDFYNFEKRNLVSLLFPRREGWRACNLTFLAKLSDESYLNIQKRGLASADSPLKPYIHSAYDLAELAELSDKEFANIELRKLLNPKLYKDYFGRLEGDDIAMLAKLSDDVFGNIQRRNLTSPKYYGFKRNFNIYDIAELAKLSDEAFLNIEKRGLMSESIAEKYDINFGTDICALAELSEEKFEFAKKFLENQYLMNRKPAATGRMLQECSIKTIEKLQKIYSNNEIIGLFSGEKGMTFLRKMGIIDLIANKKLDIDTVKSLAETINYGEKKLLPEILSDINLLKQGKSVVKEFISGTSLRRAFKSSKTGDVVQIGEKMFINDGEKLFPWQMDRKAFDKLFPPVERFIIKQRGEDCYLLVGIADCMRNPAARAELYKSFRLDGKDIICTIKAYKDFKGDVRFKNGNLPWGFNYARACRGVNMLEYAYAKTAIRDNNIGVTSYLNTGLTPYALSERISGGETSNAYHELLGLNRFDYVFKLPKINSKTGVLELETLSEAGKGNLIKAMPLPKKFSLRYGHMHSEKMWQKVLEQYANDNRYLLGFGTYEKLDDVKGFHAFSIIGYDAAKKLVKIVNPHNTAGILEIPVSKLADCSLKLYVAKIK